MTSTPVNTPTSTNTSTETSTPTVTNTPTITPTPTPTASPSPTPFVAFSITKTDGQDPVAAGKLLTYTISYSNIGTATGNSVTITESYDPNVTFVSANPPPTSGTDTWNIGTLAPGLIFQIDVTVQVSPAVLDGTILTNTATISNPNDTKQATQTTTTAAGGRQYVLTLTGAPRNLRVGVVTTMLYMIKLRNLLTTDTTNVSITNTLPDGLQFRQSVPAPTAINGNVLTYNLPTLLGGATKLVLIQASLLPTTQGGTSLVNTTQVDDDQGNSLQASYVGGVRTGPSLSPPSLSLDVTTVRQILAGSKLKYSISIDNAGRTDATGVVLTIDTPAETTFFSAIPSPSSRLTVDGHTRLIFNIGRIAGPGKTVVRLTQQVPDNVPAGTILTLTGSVSGNEGETDDVTNTVSVRGSSASPALRLLPHGQ